MARGTNAWMPILLVVLLRTGGTPDGAVAELKDANGRTIGRADLTDTPTGVLIHLRLERAPPGVHAFHVHEVGRCDAPSFESAGGHYNPLGAEHGFLDRKGAHAGDLPNLHVPAGGMLEVEVLADDLTIRGEHPLLDADGSAVVLHAGRDDYTSDPAGAAGDRVGCGVIARKR